MSWYDILGVSAKVTLRYALDVCSVFVMRRMPVGVVSSSGAVGLIVLPYAVSTKRVSLVGGVEMGRMGE